jgi:hypothetical protein
LIIWIIEVINDDDDDDDDEVIGQLVTLLIEDVYLSVEL